MEEALRGYFLRNGYYALRGVPFAYNGFDVTDVDLWLYDKPSPVVRHTIVVDIKNKRTPQAIERIFWAKGLQSTLGVDQAIVATTDKRPDVSEFGKQHGVLVIDGNFLSRLTTSGAILDDRHTEEEFIGLIDADLGRIATDWKLRLRRSKQLVLTGLGFDQVNFWLSEARFFAEQVLTVPTHKKVASRLLYLVASLIAVAVDHVLKDMTFSDARARSEKIEAGLLYGSAGRSGNSKTLDIALGLADQYLPDVPAAASRIRSGFHADINSLPAHILTEYFSRGATTHNILYVAKVLEAAAYDLTYQAPAEMPVEARAFISVLLDFWGLDRVRFMQALVSDPNFSSSAPGLLPLGEGLHGPLFSPSDRGE